MTVIAMRAERAAAALDISPSQFLKWVAEGKMPQPVKVSERIALYDYEEIKEHWAALTKSSVVKEKIRVF